MSAITVNAFPPLHTFNSPRAWFLSLIVLLHAGFFWALTHGVTFGVIKVGDDMWVVDLPPEWTDDPPPVPPEPTDIRSGSVDPVPLPPEVDYRETASEQAPQADPLAEPMPAGPGSAVRLPVIVEPMVDPRIGLSEPDYPVAEIRQQHEGTVWLSVEILPNGRVGQVRIDQSSGYQRLDDSAAREARKWRMKPGMQDGVATTMWKRVPITFRLKD
jgi:periplasmic protein TonB